ncbi:FMN-binding protein [Anaerotignum sp.]|uniref:FMN-binding protein n=1 Tax=Anaerotignum sp. TaxID=2039241 RepID=UPI0028ABC435|nr:FMN-binding protein [Anaerotignum sp.]
MIFAICLVIVAVFTFTSNNFIKKNAKLLYVVSALISVAVVTCTALGISNKFPQWFRVVVWNPFAWGSVATAIFVVVMFIGTLRRGSFIQRKLLPIRAELSIIASILTLGHNLSAGQTYFVMLFTQPSRLPINHLLATICSLIMIIIMIPLFITSFPSVRKKMPAITWKKLQRSAYVFYGLIYVHVLLLAIPRARLGHTSAMINIAVFSLVFMGYGVMRLRKALKGGSTLQKNVPIVVAAVLCIVISIVSMTRPDSEVASTSVSEPPKLAAQGDDDEFEKSMEKSITNEEAKDLDENGITELPSESEDMSKYRRVEVIEDTVSEKSQQTKTEKNTAKVDDNKSNVSQDKTKDEKSVDEENEIPKEPKKEEVPKESSLVTNPEPSKATCKYKDGTFNGSAEGYGGTIIVSVTIKDDIISGISVASHHDDEPFWSDGKVIINSILSSQSTNVNTISGATFSSSGIKQAVNVALNSAKN